MVLLLSSPSLRIPSSLLLMCYRYGTEPFAGANGKIPQVNLWDDHDVSRPTNMFGSGELSVGLHHCRSLTASVHIQTISCSVRCSGELAGQLTNTIYFSSTTMHRHYQRTLQVEYWIMALECLLKSQKMPRKEHPQEVRLQTRGSLKTPMFCKKRQLIPATSLAPGLA